MKQTKRKKQKNKAKKPLPVWAVIALDLLFLGIALNVFALFHHVLPRANTAAEPAVTAAPIRTPAPTVPPAPVRAEETTAPEEEPEKTGWAKTFEEHFTEEVVITETSYSSPNISVTIEKYEAGTELIPRVYYVADIYIADIFAFQTYLAHNTFGQSVVQDMIEMQADAGAILAMTGDFYGYQYSGVMARNGTLYRDSESDADLCVLYYDGRMVTYPPHTLDVTEAMEEGAYQIWSFGPMLLDNEGNIPEELNNYRQINGNNPRSAVGYYEPGHYCFLVMDGRQPGYSHGGRFEDLAEIFCELGCKTAYNLDGGGSAMMTLNGAFVDLPSNGGRKLSDILIIREPEAEAGEGQTETEGDGA